MEHQNQKAPLPGSLPDQEAPQLTRPDVLFGMHNTMVLSAIEALLYCHNDGIQSVLEYLSLNRVFMGNGSFCIAITHIGPADGQRPYQELLEGMRAFAERVEDRLLQKSIFYMAPVRGNIVLILAVPHFTGGTTRLEEMHTLLRTACRTATEELNQQTGLSAVTAISPMFDGMDNIPQSFHRTLDMLDYRLYFGEKNGVFVPGGPDHKPSWYLHTVSDLESQCRLQCGILVNGRLELFKQRIRETMADLRDNVPASLQQFKADCFHYVSMLIAMLMERKIIMETDVQQLDIFALIESSRNAEQLLEVLDRAMKQLLAGYFQQRREIESASANSMRRYIEEHCTDANLTISAVAEAFQMSQPAFSGYYLRKLEASPLEDLNRCRARHAYELLKSGETSLETVMQASGFASSSTMNRLFKKYYNVTPAQMRRAFRNTGGME